MHSYIEQRTQLRNSSVIGCNVKRIEAFCQGTTNDFYCIAYRLYLNNALPRMSYNNGNVGTASTAKYDLDAQNARLLLSSTTIETDIGSNQATERSGVTATSIRIILVAIGCVFAAAIIIFLFLNFSYKDDVAGFNFCASDGVLLRTSHIRCNNLINFQEKCESGTGWTKLDESTRKVHHNSVETWASPSYLIDSSTCGFQISLKVDTITNLTSTISYNRTLSTFQTVSLTTETCQTFAYKETNLSHFKGGVRMLLSFSSRVNVSQTMLSISRIPCKSSYSKLGSKQKSTTSPNFAILQGYNTNFCSATLLQRTTHVCDWWNVQDGDSSDFDAYSLQDCVSRSANPKIGNWFLGLQSKQASESVAHVLSPIIMRESDDLIIEFWYIFKCTGLKLNLYILPANKTVTAGKLVKTVDEAPTHPTWNHRSVKIKIPNYLEAFHLVIEGIVPASDTSDCQYHFCGVDYPTEAEEPFLGLDDILIVPMQPMCQSREVGLDLSCSFETKDNTSTTCRWLSSMPPYLSVYVRQFADFKPVEASSIVMKEEPLINNRTGYVLKFDGTGKTGMEPFIKSPLVTSIDNCSCSLSFSYLLAGDEAPRLLLSMTYNNSTHTRWSVFGHQGHQWHTAEVELNMYAGVPFRIFIEIREIFTSGGDVYIDDITLRNCDLTLVNR